MIKRLIKAHKFKKAVGRGGSMTNQEFYLEIFSIMDDFHNRAAKILYTHLSSDSDLIYYIASHALENHLLFCNGIIKRPERIIIQALYMSWLESIGLTEQQIELARESYSGFLRLYEQSVNNSLKIHGSVAKYEGLGTMQSSMFKNFNIDISGDNIDISRRFSSLMWSFLDTVRSIVN